MKSFRTLVRQLILREDTARLVSPSVSASTLNEVVITDGTAGLQDTSTLPPLPTPPSTPPNNNDEEESHEMVEIQHDTDLPESTSSQPAAASTNGGVENVNGAVVVYNPTDDLGLLFQRLPTPPTTALTDNEGYENDENRVEIIRSPADLPCNLPSPSSSSDDDDENSEENADPSTSSRSNNEENRDQQHRQVSEGNGTLDDLISIDVSKLSQWEEPYIAMHFRFLYWAGVVPFQFCARGDERLKLNFVHTVGHLCLLIMAVMYSLYNIKLCILQDEFENEKLKFVVRLAFVAIVVCLPIDFAIVVWRFSGNVVSMIETTRALAVVCENVVAPDIPMKKAIMLVSRIATVVTGLLFPLLTTAFNSGFDVTEVLRYQAQDFAYTLFAWKRGLNLSVFYDEYEGDMDWQTISMGLTWGTSSMLGCAYEHLVYDVPMWLAVTMVGFSSSLSTVLSTPELAQRHRQEIWRIYRLIREYSWQIDQYFGGFLQFVHFQNLAFSTYLLYYTIIVEEVGWYSLVDIITLGKMVTFYVASARAADINDTLCKWIRENHEMDDIMYENGVVRVRAQVVIDDVSNNPIGIGSKLFMVNKSSIWKGISVVGSCLVFFVESAHEVVLNSN